MRPFARLRRWLSGWPDSALTVLLLALALVIVVVALRAGPLHKAIVAAWVLFP